MHICEPGEIMVQTKRPPVIKWTPYNLGETKNYIMKEINQIVAQKDHRKKVGLETGSFREFKGNSHWNLFLNIEMIELLTKRLNSDIKTVFLQTSQGLNNANSYLTNLSQELKKAEYNLSNVTTVSNNNVVKIIRNELGKLNKVITGWVEFEKKIKETTDKLQKELSSTSDQLKQTVDESLKNFIKEFSERTEASQAVITEDIHTFKDLSQTRFDEISDLIKVNFSEISEQTVSTNDNNLKSYNDLSEKLKDIGNNLLDTQEQVVTFQDATNNRFDDSQNTVLSEFQEGVGGLMKQNLDNFENLKKHDAAQTKEIVGQIDETTNNLLTVLDATNDHMNKVNDNINENMKHTEEQYTKDLKGEMADLKTILGTIQSDINLMKSVLTKIDTKVH
jgi:hypothetical protein